MATKESWANRAKLLAVLNSMDTYIQSIKTMFESLRQMKEEILDDPAKRADLKKIIDIDPDWTIESLQAKYIAFKAIYDWLRANT